MQPPVFRSTYFHSDQHQSLTMNEENQNEGNQNNIENKFCDSQYISRSNHENDNLKDQKSNPIKIIIAILILVVLFYAFDLNAIKRFFHSQQTINLQTKIDMQNNEIDIKFDHNQKIDPIKIQQKIPYVQQLLKQMEQTQQQNQDIQQKQNQDVPKISVENLQDQIITKVKQQTIIQNTQQTIQTNQQTIQVTQQNIQTPQPKQQQIEKITEIIPQEKQQQNKQINIKQSQNDEDQFQLSFVQTQFQGKQTQESLAAAAFAKMENQINKLNKIEQSNLEELLQRKKLLQDISTLQVMIPDSHVENYVAKDFYYFSVSIQQMILNSQLQKMYRNGQTIFKISLKQHMRAIIRTQLIHNVNFKGEIQVNLSPFDKSQQQKIRAIKEIMQDEELYYESLYQLSKYNKDQLRFCLVIPSYNNVKSKLYLRNLDSIFMQDYQNYHVVYVDDASPDHTGQFVQKYIKDKNIPSQKIKLIINQKNQKALYNIYTAIHSHCPNGQIVGLIDGDDSLLGRKVLQLYNAVYQSKKTGLIYSNFLKILTNNQTSFGFGTQITKSQFREGKLRNDLSLVGTHFMTFFSDIFKKILKDDLCYDNGTFYDYAYDRAIITPLIEMAYPRVEYLPQITYEYRNDTGINDGTADWERVSKIIMRQQPYEMLQQFPFIDNFIQQKEEKLQIELKKKNRDKSNLQKNKQQLPKSYFKQDDQEEDQEQQD